VKEEIAKALEHIAAGLRDDTFELTGVDMTQNSMPTVKDDKVEYRPTGEFQLVLNYKRKDT
jgi:hypothetical protein